MNLEDHFKGKWNLTSTVDLEGGAQCFGREAGLMVERETG